MYVYILYKKLGRNRRDLVRVKLFAYELQLIYY